MSLELDPPELGFKRPFTNEVAQVLRLRNSNSTPVAFKVKTTAPKQYCVRPNSGRIDPGESVDVSVVLQPMKQDPPLDARCKDKFLVQSVEIPASSGSSPSWPEIEKTSKSAVQERKIRVHYLPSNDSQQIADTNGHTQDDDTTVFRSSPAPPYTPQTQTHQLDDSTTLGERSAVSPSLPDDNQERTPLREPAGVAREDLQVQLVEANATIARLRRELEEQSSGLRRRKEEGKEVRGATAGLGVPVLQERGTEGVPIKWVAILCLLVFLLTYLVF